MTSIASGVRHHEDRQSVSQLESTDMDKASMDKKPFQADSPQEGDVQRASTRALKGDRRLAHEYASCGPTSPGSSGTRVRELYNGRSGPAPHEDSSFGFHEKSQEVTVLCEKGSGWKPRRNNFISTLDIPLAYNNLLVYSIYWYICVIREFFRGRHIACATFCI